MKMKRFLSLFLITVLVIGLLPAQALWASAAATDAVRYLDADGIEKFAADYTLVDSDTTTMSNGWYVVKQEITVPGTVTVTGDVHLILCDGSILNTAGVKLSEGNSLTIYAQSEDLDTMGSLISTSSTNGQAAIGGYKGGSGTLVINGGKITAQSTKSFSAAIGTGASSAYASAYDCGPVTINGGVVTATAGSYGAGIGGAMNSDGGTVVVNGGTVRATGGRNASAIGAGREADGKSFTQK